MARALKKDRTARTRAAVPTLEQIAARRERERQTAERVEFERLKREADKREAERRPENWGTINPKDAEMHARGNAQVMARPRPKSVYDKLLEDDIITQAQCRAGHETVDLWARCNGLDGRDEKLMEFIDKGPGDPSAMTDKRIDAQIQWKRMLNDVGKASGLLLYALADCWILDNREPWQDTVRRVYNRAKDANPDRDRKNLAMLIYAATENARLHFGY